MSLLLDALKKAEAKQGAARGASPAPLELTALESKLAPSSDSVPADTATPKAAPPAFQTRQQQARALLQRGAVRTPGRLDGLLDYLTFPVVVGIVLVVGITWGSWVLYRSYTYMPSALITSAPTSASTLAPSPVQRLPSPVVETPSNVVLSAPNSSLPEKLERSEPVRPNALEVPAPALGPAVTPRALANSSKPLALNRGERSNEVLSDSLAGAYQALQQGDREVASNQYQRALQLDAKNLDALLGLGYLAQQSGALERAEQYFKRALQIDPRDSYALSALASLSAQSNPGDQNDAAGFERRLKNQASQNDEQNVDSATRHFALGNTLAAQQRWDEAQQAYFKAVAGAPRNPNYLFNLAVSLDQLHQSKLALEYYRKALALLAGNSASAPAQFNREPVQQRVQALERALTASSVTSTTGQP